MMSEGTPQDANSQEDGVASGPSSINPGYALGQLARALTTSETHADAETRGRAEALAEKWATVFRSILDGTLQVGSRTPLENVPAWATLEVVTGGFATGALLAGGPLRAHEEALLAQHPALASDGRTLLNAYYLSEPGLAELRAMLQSGRYAIDVPEEGALLVVAWLLEQGRGDAARALLEEIGPYFGQLRFYPAPQAQAQVSGAQVFLQDVGTTVEALRQMENSRDVLVQKEAIEVWAPLYDAVVRLWLETVEGEPPTLVRDEALRVVVDEARWPVAQGGWPIRQLPDDWMVRAQRVLDEYHHLRQMHTLADKPERAEENFTQLRMFLQRYVSAPESLSERNVRWVRVLLANYVTKYGVPDSPQHRARREQQARQVDIPLLEDVAQVVAARLAAFDPAEGLADVDAVTQPVNEEEAAQWNVEQATAIPRTIYRKVERSLVDSIAGLVARGVITSGDTLARVLPQITAEIRAAGIVDPVLRPLYAAIYRAFRRRRSLLLLNYESQVRIDELPWVAAIERFRKSKLSTRELARQTLVEVVQLTLVSFPYAIVPNKLLQEIEALAKDAGLDMPLVDEVAADIFMGDFSPRFTASAQRAAKVLDGSLYARYYGIDYAEVARLRPANNASGNQRIRWRFKEQGETLGEYCTRRAGVGAPNWNVARNGMVIEQQQIVTTQNLAVLFEALQLGDVLAAQLGAMARHCFTWICQRQQMKIDEWHGRLIMVKNTAYAWRQMIFYLAFMPQDEVAAFMAWAWAHLGEQSATFVARFRPAMAGLALVVDGGSFEAHGVDEAQTRRFLGWSMTGHWLLPKDSHSEK